MRDVQAIKMVLAALLVIAGCRDGVDPVVVDKDIKDTSDLENPANIHESALIGLYLTEIGALEEVTTAGAELAEQLQRNILFSEMDLSRFALPDMETLELLVGAKLQEGRSSEIEAAAPRDTNLGCTLTCCENPNYLYKYSRPTYYTRYDTSCSWVPVGSTTVFCACAH